ncbi:MAG: GIY-YIG nuclease family protein [Bacteroidetes bacterium]|nr:GIY-YIG nuclease family protein [Bacteroidota bacterium]
MSSLVYILYSELLNKYYVGQTDNIERRITQHNASKGNYTSKGVPWVLVYTELCKNRTEAIKLEIKIKKRGIKRYLQDKSIL